MFHHLPGAGTERSDDIAHPRQATLMMKKDLLGAGRSVRDDVAMGWVGGEDPKLLDLAERIKELPEHVGKILVIANKGSNAGKDVVAGEEHSAARITETDVGGLVPGGEDDLKRTIAPYSDRVTFVDREVGEGEERHPVRSRSDVDKGVIGP